MDNITFEKLSPTTDADVKVYKEAFDFVRELVQNQAPMSERVIQQIHYLVLADKKDDRGVYRRVPVESGCCPR